MNKLPVFWQLDVPLCSRSNSRRSFKCNIKIKWQTHFSEQEELPDQACLLVDFLRRRVVDHEVEEIESGNETVHGKHWRAAFWRYWIMHLWNNVICAYAKDTPRKQQNYCNEQKKQWRSRMKMGNECHQPEKSDEKVKKRICLENQHTIYEWSYMAMQTLHLFLVFTKLRPYFFTPSIRIWFGELCKI